MLRCFNQVRYTQRGSDMYYVGGGGNAHYLGLLVVVGWSTVSKGLGSVLRWLRILGYLLG